MNWTSYLALFISSLLPLSETENNGNSLNNKKLIFKDATYEEEIRTVRLYPNSGNPNDKFLPAVEPLGEGRLFLEFDDLVEAHEEYRVKIIHCNADWTKSKLRNLDYLNDFNEFNINQFTYSVDTKIGYVHYEFRLPRVKLPGNYLLVAYRGSDEKDIILSKRFMVYQPNVNVRISSNLNGLTSIRRTNQQIDFDVIYDDFELMDPMQTVKVVIRQNQRWDNIITIDKPNFIRELENRLEYRFFDFSNNFSAANEYRFFDLRSLRYPGQQVYKVDISKRPISAFIMADQPRIYQAYSQYNDLNGNFIIQNSDMGGGDASSDYLFVNFTLDTKEKLAGDIYVVGQMNNYDRDKSSKLTYNEQAKVYQGELLLKQGWYDYQYHIEADTLNYNYLEGNHFETENEYEILVYYRPMNLRSDVLIGYNQFRINRRN